MGARPVGGARAARRRPGWTLGAAVPASLAWLGALGWACCLLADDGRTTTNSLGMKLVRIEPGEFLRGQGDEPPRTRDEWLARDEDEAPAQRVRISRPFLLGIHEVTNAQFERFDPERKARRGQGGSTRDDDEPVVFVTWQQAVDFCQWLSRQEGKPYRLPTEAEWEYACRAGTTTLYSTGDELTHEQANLGLAADGKTRGGARPVGSYPPNPWGLYDLHGNVAEWCHDWHGPYSAAPQTDPVGPIAGHARIVRGWSHLRTGYQPTARFARSANRAAHLPDDANRYTGFRVVQAELPTTAPLPLADPPQHQRDVRQAAPPPRPGYKPAQPYFDDFSVGRRNPTIPPNTFGPIFSQHQHFTSAAVCPNGDVLAVWYTCVGESDRQLAQAASRLRAGSDRWEPASLFFGVADVNCHAPVLLRAKDRLYHFCTQSLSGWDDASNIVRHSDDNGATWSPPRIMLRRESPQRLSQPCSALVAKDGTLALACDGDNHRDARLLLSGDQGATWRVAAGDLRRSAGGRYVIHPAMFQRGDGALVTFLRGPNPMPALLSTDLGESWEASDAPFPGISVGQKAAVLKLASGAILLATFDNGRQLVGGGTLAAMSLDDGRTWPHIRKLDAPVSGYLSLAQDQDGVIYLIGSQMRFAACNEAWLKQGQPLDKAN